MLLALVKTRLKILINGAMLLSFCVSGGVWVCNLTREACVQSSYK